jgi:hypothetical protein
MKTILFLLLMTSARALTDQDVDAIKRFQTIVDKEEGGGKSSYSSHSSSDSGMGGASIIIIIAATVLVTLFKVHSDE